jgi:hypothetical protein
VKPILAILLLVATLEVVGAVAWEAFTDSQDPACVDSDKVCAESLTWLEKYGESK